MQMKERQFHIHLTKGEVGRYCILPGDPGRCAAIAAYFDHPEHMAQNREYNSYTGLLLGERVSVVSTGIGGPSAAIAMEELSAIGVESFLRVGTCGGINLNVQSGDLVIATGAIRQEGTSREYAPIEFPAVPNYAMLSALVDAAKQSGAPWHAGVVQCKDSFYGQHYPSVCRYPERSWTGGRRGNAWVCWQARWNRRPFSRLLRRLACAVPRPST